MFYRVIGFFITLLFISNPAMAEMATPAKKTSFNCLLAFPEKQSYIEQMKFIRRWGSHASKKIFRMNHDVSDAELASKKDCFTPSGWKQYYQALHQSGNLNTIRQNHFQTNTMINGNISTKSDRVNKTWTLHIPLEIVYQNEKTRVTQSLDVFMLIGLQSNGRLGIMQLIGKPINLPTQKTG